MTIRKGVFLFAATNIATQKTDFGAKLVQNTGVEAVLGWTPTGTGATIGLAKVLPVTPVMKLFMVPMPFPNQKPMLYRNSLWPAREHGM
jgi:hypothetical protein